jgi:hypothetical protein
LRQSKYFFSYRGHKKIITGLLQSRRYDEAPSKGASLKKYIPAKPKPKYPPLYNSPRPPLTLRGGEVSPPPNVRRGE